MPPELPATPKPPELPAVRTTDLSRVYGDMAALSSLNLTVNRGDLFGFIGSNGATPPCCPPC